MSNALKNLFSNLIILEDNSEFYYTIKTLDLTNALGNIIAVLKKYNFTRKDDNTAQFFCKLFTTNKGNYYDFEAVKLFNENGILRKLKPAIDAIEKTRF